MVFIISHWNRDNNFVEMLLKCTLGTVSNNYASAKVVCFARTGQYVVNNWLKEQTRALFGLYVSVYTADKWVLTVILNVQNIYNK